MGGPTHDDAARERGLLAAERLPNGAGLDGLTALYASLPAALGLFGTDLQLRNYNQRFAQLFGLSNENEQGRALPSGLVDALRHTVASQAPAECEFSLDDGSTHTARRSLRALTFLLHDGAGAPSGVGFVGFDVTTLSPATQRLQLFANVCATLGELPDEAATFAQLFDLLVPEFADGALSLLRGVDAPPRGNLRFPGPASARWHALRGDLWPFAEHGPLGHEALLRSGKPVLYAALDEQTLRAAARSSAHLEALLALSATSLLLVPLRIRGTTEGVLALFCSTSSGRRFSQEDLMLAEDLSVQLGIALDRQRLLRELAVTLDALRTAKERLEQRVLDRTAELSRKTEALEDARAEAVRANAAKSSFLAHMSHELRTPMNGLLGLTSLLLESSLTADQRDLVQTVRACGDTLLSILNEVLDLSKIEAGRMSLEQRPFVLRELIRHLEELFRPVAHARGLRFEVHVAPKVPDGFVGDSLRLRQVLTNLLGNALKFTAEGSVVMHVDDVAPEGSEVSQLLFSVRDTGIGISPEQEQRLFQPFVQADASIARKYGGTGLGLTIARELLALMSGTVSVESALGVGTTIYARVPLRVVEVRPPALAPPSPDAGIPADQKPLRILVAEDNAVNRKVVLGMLKRLGHSADVVENGALAVRAAMERRYDVVLMDVHMPELSGTEASMELRKRYSSRELRIVALTAATFDEDRKRCLEAGMDDFLCKPLRLEDLAAALQRASVVE